ncbi:exonuclease SbcCD subunit D [Gleimia hominis]|uniref:Nuclease SbcCD subunit D n=1 Tax=Gleimia hominis TaxID=595468 RepID=A0ABU3IAH8_9ACTO|nr:exonuclease SbcCD subunit D [Gleimia hominis]MDT3767356.1 exonuclease SbcCD subunit D [Gleimia hominis]
MKFIHTSDWHLGRTLANYPLQSFQEQFLDHFVDLVTHERPDAVLLAGDVFDRAIAPQSAMVLLEDTLRRLAELTQVVMISGNHDAPVRLGYGSSLYTDRVRVFIRCAQVGTPVSFGDVHVYPVPFLEPDEARFELAPSLDEPLPRTHDDVMAAALRRIDADLSARGGVGIAMVHAFVAGSKTSESERDIAVGGSQASYPETFARMGSNAPASQLAYVAAGHLHRAQQLHAGGTPIRYCGTPLPYSFSEANYAHSTTIVTVTGKDVSIRTVPVPQPYQLVNLRGSLQEVLNQPVVSNAFYSIELTDPIRPERAYEQVKNRFETALVVRHTGTVPVDQAPQRRNLDPTDLVAAFFETTLDRNLSPSERILVRDTWEQVRKEEHNASA